MNDSGPVVWLSLIFAFFCLIAAVGQYEGAHYFSSGFLTLMVIISFGVGTIVAFMDALQS